MIRKRVFARSSRELSYASVFRVNTTPDRCRRAAGGICGSRELVVVQNGSARGPRLDVSPAAFFVANPMYDVHLSGAVCLTGQLSGPTPAHPSIRSARRDAPDRTTRESRVQSSRRKCEKKSFALKVARSRCRPTPRANPRVSISSARRRLAMRSIVREFTAPASRVRRGWFIRESASPKVASPSLTKVTHFFVTASHAARTSSGGATTPKSFSKCS